MEKMWGILFIVSIFVFLIAMAIRYSMMQDKKNELVDDTEKPSDTSKWRVVSVSGNWVVTTYEVKWPKKEDKSIRDELTGYVKEHAIAYIERETINDAVKADRQMRLLGTHEENGKFSTEYIDMLYAAHVKICGENAVIRSSIGRRVRTMGIIKALKKPSLEVKRKRQWEQK